MYKMRMNNIRIHLCLVFIDINNENNTNYGCQTGIKGASDGEIMNA